MSDQAETALHPICSLFPNMEPDQLAELANDIRQHGLREMITTLGGAILDGKNRERACRAAGVEPQYFEWERLGIDGSPVAWAVSKNLRRRDLTESQRASIASEMLPLLESEAAGRRRSAPRDDAKNPPGDTKNPCGPRGPRKRRVGRARDIAARAVGVSGRTVARAKRVADKSPEKMAEVRAGTKTVAEAEREVAQEEAASKASEILDGLGRPVEERFREAFTAPIFNEIARDIQRVEARIEALVESPLGRHVQHQGIGIELRNAKRAIKAARPYAPCGYCRRKGCKTCKKQGWVTKLTHDHAPAENKGDWS